MRTRNTRRVAALAAAVLGAGLALASCADDSDSGGGAASGTWPGADKTECADLGALQPASGDREVFHGPLGLRAPQGRRRNPHLTHGVVLNPILAIEHASSLARETAVGTAALCT